MDKLYYTQTGRENQEIEERIIEIQKKCIEQLKGSPCIQRKRILTDEHHLLIAMIRYIFCKLSFQRLSDFMARNYGIVMSDTAWKKQFKKCAVWFLQIAKNLFSEELSRHPNGKTILNYAKVYAVDATEIPQEGQKNTNIRIHTTYSLTQNCVTETVISDNHTAESILHTTLEEGSLYLADRGYGRATQFAALLETGADFIIRIAPTNIRLYTDETCRNRVEFSVLLSGTAAERLSLHCWFRVRKKVYPLRITASRIPEEQTEAAEKRVRAKASKSGRKILETTILFSRWVVLASSLPTAIKGRDLFHVYRLRWQVELFFKRCKSLLNFHKLRKSNSDYLFAVASDFLAIVYLVSSLVSRFSELFSLTSLFDSFSLALFSLFFA